MKKIGWTPSKSISERIEEVVKWSLNNLDWITL